MDSQLNKFKFTELQDNYNMLCPHCDSIQFIALKIDEDLNRLRINFQNKAIAISDIPCSHKEYMTDQLDTYVFCNFSYISCSLCNHFYYIIYLYNIGSEIDSDLNKAPDEDYIENYYGLSKPSLNINTSTNYIVKPSENYKNESNLPDIWLASEVSIDSNFTHSHVLGPFKCDNLSSSIKKTEDHSDFNIDVNCSEMKYAANITYLIRSNVHKILFKKRIDFELEHELIDLKKYNFYLNNYLSDKDKHNESNKRYG